MKRKKILIKFSSNGRNYKVRGFLTKSTKHYFDVEYKAKPDYQPFISNSKIKFVPDLKTKKIKIWKKNISYIEYENNDLKFIV